MTEDTVPTDAPREYPEEKFGRELLPPGGDVTRPEQYLPKTLEYTAHRETRARRGYEQTQYRGEAAKSALTASRERLIAFLRLMDEEAVWVALERIRYGLEHLYENATPATFRLALVEMLARIYPKRVSRADGITALTWWAQQGSAHPVCPKPNSTSFYTVQAWDDGLWSTKAIAELVGAQHSNVYATLDRYRPGWRNFRVKDDECVGSFAYRLERFREAHGYDVAPNEWCAKHPEFANEFRPAVPRQGETRKEQFDRAADRWEKRTGLKAERLDEES